MPNYWVDHIHLISPDPLKTAEFYEKTFGAKREAVNKGNDGRMTVNLSLNGAPIRVMSPRPKPLVPSTSPNGLEHFGLRTDDIETAVKELKAKGVKFVQDITAAGPGVKISFFLAPENVLIELLERKA